MDRYRNDYEKLQEKGKEPEKVKEKQTKYINMKKAYDELNEELKMDMPKLLSDKGNFYTPLFAMLIFHELEYYRESDKACQPVGESTSGIDTQAAHTHAQVITPETESAYTMEINLDAAVREDEDELSSARQQRHEEVEPEEDTLMPPPAAVKTPSGPKKVGGMPPKKMAGGPPPKKAGALPPRKMPAKGPPRKQAKALYPFQGQDDSELSFNPGDVLTILKDEGDWWEAELGGQRGLIPANYVAMI